MGVGEEILGAVRILQGEGNRWVADEAIVEKLGLSLQKVRGWLEILHEEDRVCLEETLEQHEAYLSDKHKVMMEQRDTHVIAQGPAPLDLKSVFVVHGRNEQARHEVFSFLHSLSLEPLQWEKIIQLTEEASPYIGTVLEKGFSVAQAAIVLMTPDDEARLRTSWQSPNDDDHECRLTPQPRQNVLLEAGMALAKYANRTVILQFGQVRRMSDLLGRHVIHIQDDHETRSKIANRLKTAGCAVDTDTSSDWQQEGDFKSVLEAIERAAARDALQAPEEEGQLDVAAVDEHDCEIARRFLQAFPPQRLRDFLDHVIYDRVTSDVASLEQHLRRFSGVEMRFLSSQIAQSFDDFIRETQKLIFIIATLFERDGDDGALIHKQPQIPAHMQEYLKERHDLQARAVRVKGLHEALIMCFKRKWPKMAARLLLPD